MFYKYIPTTKNITSIKDTKILSFGYTEFTDEPSILHSHSNCEILVPLNDYGYLKFINKNIPLSKDKIIIINSNVTHTEICPKLKEGKALKYYSIRFNLEIKKGIEDYFVIENKQCYDDLIFYLSKAYSLLIKNDDVFGQINLSCAYYQLLSFLEKNEYTVKHLNSKFIPEYIIKAKNHILTNYGHNLSLEELAQQLNISINSLTTKFKENYGSTPKKFLINTRINMAKHLLSTTNYSISQISYLCGFKTPAYFIKIFKKDANLTPQNYRKSNS